VSLFFVLLSQGCQRVPRHVDDFARTFALSADEAQDVLQAAARRTNLPEEQIADIAIAESSLIRTQRNRFEDIMAELRARADDFAVEDAIESTFCGHYLNVRLFGDVPTVEEVRSDLEKEVGFDAAEALLATGRIGDFVDLMEALQTGDSQEVAEAVASALYC